MLMCITDVLKKRGLRRRGSKIIYKDLLRATLDEVLVSVLLASGFLRYSLRPIEKCGSAGCRPLKRVDFQVSSVRSYEKIRQTRLRVQDVL